jgi:hypothetical protein
LEGKNRGICITHDDEVSVNGIGFNNESCFDNKDIEALDNASVNDNDGGDIFSFSSSFVFFEVDRITNASIFLFVCLFVCLFLFLLLFSTILNESGWGEIQG